MRTAANCSCKSGIGSSGLDLIKPPESVGVKINLSPNKTLLKNYTIFGGIDELRKGKFPEIGPYAPTGGDKAFVRPIYHGR